MELVERAIANSSAKGGTVLDPFAGAGSTVLAAERMGRRACVVEIDPIYADVIVRRWESYSGLPARLESDGRTLEEVGGQRRADTPSDEQVA